MDWPFVRNLARAFGGALIFSLPLFMTMEMWTLGHSMSPARLLLLLTMTIPLLIGLSHFIGFEPTFGFVDDAADSLVAFGIALVSSGALLWLFGVIDARASASSAIAAIVLHAIPGSIGALLAQSEFGAEKSEQERHPDLHGYSGEMFVMLTGALFLAFNVAPTEEMVVIARMMSDLQTAILITLSVVVMHGFVYSVEFRGGVAQGRDDGWKPFMTLTIPGYALCVILSAYVLWTFGRLDGLSLEEAVPTVLVLAFPAAVGAASARLVL